MIVQLVVELMEHYTALVCSVGQGNLGCPGPGRVDAALDHHGDGGVGGAAVDHDAGLRVEEVGDGERLGQQTQPRDLDLLEQEPQQLLLHRQGEAGRLREHQAGVGPLRQGEVRDGLVSKVSKTPSVIDGLNGKAYYYTTTSYYALCIRNFYNN